MHFLQHLNSDTICSRASRHSRHGRAWWCALVLVLAGVATLHAQEEDSSRSATAPIIPRRPLSPLQMDPFPYDTGAYRHTVEFDSTSGTVRVYETWYGVRVGEPRVLTLEEYVNERSREMEHYLLERRGASYDIASAPRTTTSSGGRDSTGMKKLDEIVGDYTKIEIPLPQNPITTLFGSPKVSIQVQGSVNLSAGWEWNNNNVTSIGELGTTQSVPFLRSSIQTNVSASIGEKLNLKVDFDNLRQFDFDNQLKIAFGGNGTETDDDIIQFVEAGNVTLQTPSTLINGSSALFGVKAGFKFGPLLLTAIASQKRGERKTITVNNGATRNSIVLRPYDYAQNHFWLDTAYRRFWDVYYRNTPPAATPEMEPFNIVELEVYEQVKDAAIAGQFQAIAYADLRAINSGLRYTEADRTFPTSSAGGSVQLGSFKRLDPASFEYDRQLGTVTIKALQQDRMYAVAYRISSGLSWGELSNTRSDSGKVAVLKLIYVSNLQPGFTTLWNRQMKNVYQLQGVRNVDISNSAIRVTFGVPPDTSEVFRVSGAPRIVTALGVDRYNTSNEATPDGQFDIRIPAFFNPTNGEIIFPSTEPFRSGLRASLGANAEPFVLDGLYNRTRDEARLDTRANQYTIAGDIAGAGGSRIQLGAFGLAPGSVRVFANGEQLKEGIDYRLDGFNGEVALLSAKAANSTGSLTVEYEQNDLITTAVRTLLGLRADYDLLDNRFVRSRLGMTFMRYSQSIQTDKLLLDRGDEPTSNTMLGFDGTVEYKPGWLTRAIDALPFIDTKEPSLFTARAEWATSIPDPSTLSSLVASDSGRGAAYIDDFESNAKRQIQLSTNYSYWRPASAPADDRLGSDDSSRVARKGLFWWYNRQPANINENEVYPNRDAGFAFRQISVLDMLFDPAERGIYNPNKNYASVSRDSVWGGMMRALSVYNTNLNNENVDFIEITMKVAEGMGSDAKMYIELGQISEDLIPNRILDTEDGITAANPQRDDILNEGEDIGIDGLNNDQERALYGNNDEDPARDDYRFSAQGSDNPQDYTRVNGMEGNVGQERGPFPDAEDLNNNRGLDLDNSYFRYEVNLDPNPATNPQIIGGGDNPNGWRQYRIPIRTGYTAVGAPSLANVQFARIWIKSANRVWVRVAEMNLVGSDWRNLNNPQDTTRDPKLNIAFVNFEDNAGAPDFYTIPPGVQQERDRIDDRLKNEQSLAIRVADLQQGETRGAIKIRPRTIDAFNYRQLKFFLHGSGDMDDRATPGQPAKAVAFLRFGADSLNYYEYRVPLLAGWNEYTVNFPDLAAIKEGRDPTNLTAITVAPVPGQPGNQFAVRGQPTLTAVQFVAFGITNNAYPGALTTTMWVDELRATQPEDGSDWAATVQANLKLADLGTIDFNAARTNPNFHRLEERFGNRIEQTNWAVNMLFQLEKFLPNSFKGSSISFTYNHVERIDRPQYVANTDVDVENAARQVGDIPGIDPVTAQRRADSLRRASQTLVVQDGFSFRNLKIAFPGADAWWVSDILNRFTFGYTYDQTRERSPIIEQRYNWQWDFTGRYDVSIPAKYGVRPLTFFDGLPVLSFFKDYKINLLPRSLAFGTAVHRDRTTEKLRNIADPSPVVRNFFSTRTGNFNWQMTEGGLLNISTDYTVETRSTLVDLETDSLGRQRSGGDIAGDLFFNGGVFNFGRDNDYQQSITFNTSPRIPYITDVLRITPSASYQVKYHWQDQLGQALTTGSYTKSADWNSTTRLGLSIPLQSIGNAMFGDQPGRPSDSNQSTITSILRYLIKIPFLDFSTLRLNFTQLNTSKNPGVVGGSGFSNLWARSLLFRDESPQLGPGLAYQLGLTADPHGTLSGGDIAPGIRAPNIYVQDNYTQKNTLTMGADRTLWPGATLGLTWNLDYGMNKNYSVTTDADGRVAISNPLMTVNLTRTYLSLPDVFFFGALDNDIEGVVNEYAQRKSQIPEPVDPGPGATPEQRAAFDSASVLYNRRITDVLSETFEEQLEAFNWLPGKAARYLPRMNYRFQWNGLEKLPFMSGWAQSVSLRHEYKGQFSRNFRVTDEGEVPETETVTRGFSPLVQLTVTGKRDAFNGDFTGSISYNTTADFSLIASARSEISKELKNELVLQASYLKRGLEISFLGLKLQNDVEFALNFSLSQNQRKRFNLVEFRPEGNNDGFTRINLRPSARYNISNTVQATAFVEYNATIPDDEGSRQISRSTTRVGIDLRVGISGGR